MEEFPPLNRQKSIQGFLNFLVLYLKHWKNPKFSKIGVEQYDFKFFRCEKNGLNIR